MSPIARFKWLATLAATDARSAVLRVAIVLGYRLNAKTLQLNPSIKTIATGTGLTARSVYRALNYLQRRGWLHRERGGGRGHRTGYCLDMPETVTPVSPFSGSNADSPVTLSSVNPDNPVTERVTPVSSAYKEGTRKGTRKREARKRATPAPESFAITEELRSWVQSNDLCDVDLKAETEKFLDHHRSKGSSFKDWTAAWRNWIRRAEEWGRSNRGNSPAQVKVPPSWATDDLVTVGRQHGVEARQKQ